MLADEEYKFIRDYAITDASVHDRVAYLSILSEKVSYADQEAFGDSAKAFGRWSQESFRQTRVKV